MSSAAIPTIEADFRTDLTNFYRSELASWGYVVPTSDDNDEVAFKYFNIQRRRIEPKVRQVLASRELIVPLPEKAGFDALVAKMKAGQDINPHLSKQLLSADYHDQMLNDWGIHHFHLGVNPTVSGFVERTGPLLFAIVTDGEVGLINVYSHGAWADKVLLEIVLSNWPDFLDRVRMRGAVDMESEPTESERLELRKAHINTAVKLSNGAIYAPLGMGQTTSGHSVHAVRSKIEWFKAVDDFEKYIRSNVGEIATEIASKGKVVPAILKVSLVVKAFNQFHAVENSTGLFLYPNYEDVKHT